MRPNLFIIGAMKCGTISLYNYLKSHPEIYMCRIREPCYFVNPSQLKSVWLNRWKNELWKSEEAYLSLFKTTKGEKIIGESSTLYTKLPQLTKVPKRIFDFNPDSKLIYIMRDPVMRTISHYWHRVRIRGEYRNMLNAIQEERHYCDVSNYAMQLSSYFDFFCRDQVYTLTLERMSADPVKIISKIFSWLGVDPSFKPPNLTTAYHRTPQYVEKVRKGLYKIRYTKFLKMIARFSPLSFYTYAHKLYRKQINRDEVDIDETIDYLRPIQLRQTQALSEMLGKNFFEWATLFGKKNKK